MYTRLRKQTSPMPNANQMTTSSENISFATKYSIFDDMQTIHNIFGIDVPSQDGQIETLDFSIESVVQLKGIEECSRNINIQQFLMRQNKGKRSKSAKNVSSAANSNEDDIWPRMEADVIKEEPLDEADEAEIIQKRKRRGGPSTIQSSNGNVEIKQETTALRRSTRANSIARRPTSIGSANGNSGTQNGAGRRVSKRQKNGRQHAAGEVSGEGTSESPIKIEDDGKDQIAQLVEPLTSDGPAHCNTDNSNIADGTVQLDGIQTNDTVNLVDADFQMKMEEILCELESGNGEVPITEQIDLTMYLMSTDMDTVPLEAVILDEILDQEDLSEALNLVIDETATIDIVEPSVTDVNEVRVVHSPNFNPAKYQRPDAHHEKAIQDDIDFIVPKFGLYSNTKLDTRLFSKFCPRSLTSDEKCTNAECQFAHELPTREELLKIINQMDCIEVLGTYNSIVLRCSKLFRLYFAAFTTYFGGKGLRWQLTNMIADTEHPHRELFKNFFHILRSYCLSGMTYADGLKMLIANRTAKHPEADRIILMLILDCKRDDILQFLNELNAIACNKDYPMDIEVIQKLMVVATEVNNKKLITNVWNILQKHRAMAKTIKASDEYKKFREQTLKLIANNN